MSTPYTGGKKGSNKSGGHTSEGNTPAPNNRTRAGAKGNTRVANFGRRTHNGPKGA